MDSTSAELALRHTFDNGLRAHLTVATGEHTFAVGHKVVWVGLDSCPFRPFHTGFLIQHRFIRLLAIGRNDRVARDDILGAGDGHRATATTGIRLAQFIALELQSLDLAILNDDARGLRIVGDLRTLGLGILDLFHRGSHLSTGAAIDGVHLRAETHRGARAVESCKTAAENDDFVALFDRYGLTLDLFAQEGNGIDHALGILARGTQRVTGPGTDSDIDGVKALREEIIDGEVASELDVGLEFDTQLPDVVQFTIHHIFRQAILRNAIAQHAARLRLHLENLAVMPFERQVVGAGQASRAGTNNSDALAGRRILHIGNRRIKQAGFSSMTMHATNGNLFFNQTTTTRLLARSGTGQTQDVGEGQDLFNQARRLFHRAFSDQFQVAGDVDMCWAINLAGRLTVGIVV